MSQDLFYRALKERPEIKFTKRLNTPLFALIIGINDYRFAPLKGPVADAEAFYIFLTAQLLVPHQNIVNLRNANATRARIISELESLAHRDDIPQNAAILIYFSGHGCRIPVPEDWGGYHTVNGEIEMMCPVDIFSQDQNTNETISGIPDRVISSLIHEVSAAHGNNVVAIFDCCHSGGMYRTSGLPSSAKSTCRAMTVPSSFLENPPPLLNNKDKEILARTKGMVVNGPHNKQESAYVLLAAVSGESWAGEQSFGSQEGEIDLAGGYFTTFLLEALKSSPNAIHEFTYKSLLDNICVKMRRHFGEAFYEKQLHPQAEGLHMHRRLFSVDIVDRLVTGTWNTEKQKMTIDAGVIHGVTYNSTFSIYSDDATASNPLAENIGVAHADSEYTVLHTPTGINIPSLFYAKVNPLERVSIRLADDRLLSAFNKIDMQNRLGITIVDPKSEHDLCVTVETGSIVFYWGTDNAFTKLLGHRIPGTLPLASIDRLIFVIRAFATFKYRLWQIAPEDDEVKQEVSVQLRKIARQGLRRVETGDNLLGEASFVTIRPDSNNSGPLCLTITNNIANSAPLYLYIFYFSSKLEITPVFLPGHGSNVAKLHDPTINPKGVFSLGMGDGGAPVTFELPEGTDTDFGYLKVFLTMDPVDFYPFMQESPFNDKENQKIHSRGISPPRNNPYKMPRPTHRRTILPFHEIISGGKLSDLRRVELIGNSTTPRRTHRVDNVDEPFSFVALKYAVVQKRA